MTILVLIGMVFVIIWEMFHGRISCWGYLSASAAASEFCEWLQFGIDVYIPHRKYQVKPHSFHLYQKDNSCDSKVKFRQASNHCKRALGATKLAYANKTKLLLSKNLALSSFDKILIVISTKVNLLLPIYSTAWRCCLLPLIKKNCLLKTFLCQQFLSSHS